MANLTDADASVLVRLILDRLTELNATDVIAGIDESRRLGMEEPVAEASVERFEAAVEAHGGDLMVDDLKSAQPDDRHFVLPRRESGEAVRDYIARIDAATGALRKHKRGTD